jgi:hypothetical protein
MRRILCGATSVYRADDLRPFYNNTPSLCRTDTASRYLNFLTPRMTPPSRLNNHMLMRTAYSRYSLCRNVGVTQVTGLGTVGVDLPVASDLVSEVHPAAAGGNTSLRQLRTLRARWADSGHKTWRYMWHRYGTAVTTSTGSPARTDS